MSGLQSRFGEISTIVHDSQSLKSPEEVDCEISK